MPSYCVASAWRRAVDPAWLRPFADDRGMAVVADACPAPGTTINGAQAGIEATVGYYSTHHLKLLSTGEGGFLTTDDNNFAASARAYRGHWLTPPAGQQPLTRLAHNFRLAEALAAIGRRELAWVKALIQQRIEQTALLLELLADVPQLRPVDKPAGQQWNAYTPLHSACGR